MNIDASFVSQQFFQKVINSTISPPGSEVMRKVRQSSRNGVRHVNALGRLPSRIAAMSAIRETQPVFVTRTEMNEWLRSDEISFLTDQADWPTADTAAIWKQFRSEALAGPLLKWSSQVWNLEGDIPARANPNIPDRIS